MANPEHLAKIKEGVDAWNNWRRANAEIIPDLRGANLGSAQLRTANLRAADLNGANLLLADLSGADLTRAQMREAVLLKANLRMAILTAAQLRGSHLTGANLTDADLGGANLDGAGIGDTTFVKNDLSGVNGLDTVIHYGPSTIDIATVYRSQGNIPLVFLRGAGVPEDFVVYMKSLATSPIQFYSCFISYSTKDQDFADRLYADLQNKGVRCWFAPHDIQSGKKIHEQIDEAIRLHDKLLLILSPHSMQSEWVKTEIAKARKRELRDQRRVLFPVRLAPFETLRDWECFDADTGKDSAREIREYFIPDFSHWKNHDSYQEAFQSLIRDLKASDAKPK
jgi:TIR domain/Pentapeptide repeats (8 copies)